jgi:hypothetical protein
MVDPVKADLLLPEQEFAYSAGKTDRPWDQFIGRWRAIKPHLARMLAECNPDRPLRVVDVGSCTGFMALQMAHQHKEADIVGIEGSVGIGNGGAGMQGTKDQILQTPAVQTHFHWIQQTQLSNCFVAPEVWDYQRVCELAAGGKPICDAMLTLSVIHHIDTVSHEQYASKGMSRAAGVTELIGKLLLLSPRHFIELPYRPWLEAAYDAYTTQKAILEAAAKASGKTWRFTGPIFQSVWFGTRELWILECEDDLGQVDVQECPFPLIYRGDEEELADYHPDDEILPDEDPGVQAAVSKAGRYIVDHGAENMSVAASTSSNPLAKLDMLVEERHRRFGLAIDPGYLTLDGDTVADERIGRALATAPTDLLIAHLALRDAFNEAQVLLHDYQMNVESQKQGQQQQTVS